MTNHYVPLSAIVAFLAAVQVCTLASAADEPIAQPAWAIGYGKEFWRESALPDQRKPVPTDAPVHVPESINMGDVIERVSHAFAPASTSEARVTGKTYTARFDERGLRFSPGVKHGTQSSSPALVDAEHAIEAAFRTVRIRHDTGLIYDAGRSSCATSVLGNTAQRLLEPELGVIEGREDDGARFVLAHRYLARDLVH